MVVKQFKTKSGKEYTLKCTIPEFLAIQTVFSITDIQRSSDAYSFILEHVYTQIAGTDTPVKEEGKDIYWPASLADDLVELQNICIHVVAEVMLPTFQKSSELNPSQQ